MLFSQSHVFNKFGSSSQFQSNPSFISWPNKYLNRILAQTYCAQMTNINSTEKNIQCDWTYNFFLFSFLRSTGREYALKIIKKSKCRGKVSTKKKSYESKRLFFFQETFCERSVWEAVGISLLPGKCSNLFGWSLCLPSGDPWTVSIKAAMCLSRCVCWFSSWLVVRGYTYSPCSSPL